MSLAATLVERASAAPSAPAARTHRHGIWNVTTWAALRQEASEVGMALRSRGVEAGSVVAIIAKNQVPFVAAEVGAQGIGARTLLIDPGLGDEEVAALLLQHGAIAVVVGDEEQHDKVIEHIASLPLVKTVAVVETRGLRHLDDAEARSDALVVSYQQLLGLGRPTSTEWVGLVSAQESTGAAAIFGSSVVGHAALVASGETIRATCSLSASDSTLPLVSFANPSSHSVLCAAIVSGFPMQFGWSEQRVLGDLRSVRPTILHASGSVLNAMKADADRRAQLTKGLKRASYEAGIRRGANTTRARTSDRPVMLMFGALLAAGLLIYSALVADQNPFLRVIVPILVALGLIVGAARLGFLTARPVRNRYGVGRVRQLLHTDAAASSETLTWLKALGVPVVAAETDSYGFLTGSGQ